VTVFVTLSALIGMTLIVVRSTIFKPIRRLWPTLLECCQCVGMWVGIAAGASGLLTSGHGRVLDAVVAGAATSFLAMSSDAVLLNLLGDPNKEPWYRHASRHSPQRSCTRTDSDHTHQQHNRRSIKTHPPKRKESP
jgi:hypothetical protein